jgi:hypothetical protein
MTTQSTEENIEEDLAVEENPEESNEGNVNKEDDILPELTSLSEMRGKEDDNLPELTSLSEMRGEEDNILPELTSLSEMRREAQEEDASSTSSLPVKSLSLSFQAGDHITRWEMLPIAWPIQVHGIVLEVEKDRVVLVDFGMQAIMKGSEDLVKEEDEKNQIKSFEKFQKSIKAGRQRLNIRTLFNQKDINKWSKVNYDGGIFGLNKAYDEKLEIRHDKSASSNELGTAPEGDKADKAFWWSKIRKPSKQESESLKLANKQSLFSFPSSRVSESFVSRKEGNQRKDKRNTKKGGWWRFSAKSSTKDTHGEFENIKNDDYQSQKRFVKTKNIVLDDPDLNNLSELERRDVIKAHQEEAHKHKDISMNDIPSTEENKKTSTICIAECENKDKHDRLFIEKNGGNISTNDNIIFSLNTGLIHESKTERGAEQAATQESEAGKEIEGRHCTIVSTEPTTSKITSEILSEQRRPQQTERRLSKADPTKLVLARTHWLLEHGETILPPYHVFSSNSECMAVFCKTGLWSTLQADVFLHSTAICNAKSGFFLTLGAVASVPLLAPVVGLAGLVAVGAPWAYLWKSKDAAQEAQQQMTDSFWAQADSQVFVTCIEEWSNITCHNQGNESGKYLEDMERSDSALVGEKGSKGIDDDRS